MKKKPSGPPSRLPQYATARPVQYYLLIYRPNGMHDMQTIAVDDPARLLVCLSRGFAVQTRLNGSGSCLE